MNTNTSIFMLEEYKQIANAYQDLHAQQNELVKTYLTIVAVPASVLAVLLQLNITGSNVVGNMFSLELILLLIKVLLVVLILIGLAVVFALISNRAEALLYVKTVNCVRRFFVDEESSIDLKKYLILPAHDEIPKYWEGLSSRSFWNIAIVAILNSGIFAFTMNSFLISDKAIKGGVVYTILLGLGWFALQEMFHWQILMGKDKKYIPKFPIMEENIKIGIDLDGVLGDLVSEVIKKSWNNFHKKIKNEQIISHNLTECTNLTNDEMVCMFKETDIFEKIEPFIDSAEFSRQLKNRNVFTYIVTDRFWTDHDWSTAKNWLTKHNIFHDQLLLVKSKDKAEFSRLSNVRYFIEDNIDTARDLSGVCEKVFLIDATYNQGDLPTNVYRVSSLMDVLGQLI